MPLAIYLTEIKGNRLLQFLPGYYPVTKMPCAKSTGQASGSVNSFLWELGHPYAPKKQKERAKWLAKGLLRFIFTKILMMYITVYLNSYRILKKHICLIREMKKKMLPNKCWYEIHVHEVLKVCPWMTTQTTSLLFQWSRPWSNLTMVVLLLIWCRLIYAVKDTWPFFTMGTPWAA